jgi:D-inositol-3-phosphate glycosyltransferase
VPVVASGVGGLLTLVDHGESGFLVPDRDPRGFARHVARLLDDPALAAEMGRCGARRSRRYTWSLAAARLRRAYADLGVRELVACA